MRGVRQRWITAAVAGLATATSLTGCLHGELVSRSPGGPPADAVSRTAGISRTGRFVAFVSGAGNLVPGDTNGLDDLFVRDNVTGGVQRVSLEADGSQLDNTGVTDGWISSDGSRAAFRTTEPATADDTESLPDVFSRNLASSQTVRATVQPAGVADQPWSGNPSKRGDLMVFGGATTNYVFSLGTGVSTALPGSNLDRPRISDDGTVIAGFMVHTVGPTAQVLHVSFKDAATGTVDPGVAVTDDALLPEGPYHRFDMTPDGRYVGVTFMTLQAGFVGVARRFDRISRTTTAAPGRTPGFAEGALEFGTTLSDDGRYLAYSRAIVNRQANIYPDFSVYDTATAAGVTRVGTAATNTMPQASISGDGRWVAFETPEQQGSGDTNALADVVVKFGHEPLVRSVAPTTLAPGAHTVSLSATGTLGLTSASVSGAGVSVGGVRVVSPMKVELDVVVSADAAPGARDIVLGSDGSWPGRPLVGAVGGCTACVRVGA